MTREEAVKVLKHTVGNINYDAEREEIYFTGKWVKAYEMAIDALREPQWISVEERLPERKDARHQRDFYLVALSNGTVKELAYEHDHYDNMLFDVGWHPTAHPVTHWMPLPEPPEVTT